MQQLDMLHTTVPGKSIWYVVVWNGKTFTDVHVQMYVTREQNMALEKRKRTSPCSCRNEYDYMDMWYMSVIQVF